MAEETKKCPHCYSDIDARASVCPNCARDIEGDGEGSQGHDPLMILGAIIAGIGLAVLIGVPILIPMMDSPRWPPWAILLGGTMLLIGYFRRG